MIEDFERLAHIITIGHDKIHFSIEGIRHNNTGEYALYFNLSDMPIQELINDPLVRSSSLIFVDEFISKQEFDKVYEKYHLMLKDFSDKGYNGLIELLSNTKGVAQGKNIINLQRIWIGKKFLRTNFELEKKLAWSVIVRHHLLIVYVIIIPVKNIIK